MSKRPDRGWQTIGDVAQAVIARAQAAQRRKQMQNEPPVDEVDTRGWPVNPDNDPPGAGEVW